jgi:hypothetical protein
VRGPIEVKSRAFAAALILWAAALVMSIAALSISCYMLVSERIDWSCERNGHTYEARYELDPVSKEMITAIDEAFSGNIAALEALDKSRKKTYVCDVCRYCGGTIERKP